MSGLPSWMLFYLVLLSLVKGECMYRHMLPGGTYKPDTCRDKASPRCHLFCHSFSVANSTSLNATFLDCEKKGVGCTAHGVNMQPGDSCRSHPCAAEMGPNCLHEIECFCEGNSCTATTSLLYLAARLGGSIMQPTDFSIYRYSIFDNFTDETLSPETFAIERGVAAISSDFNPRMRVDRHLFTHLRNMALLIASIGIGGAFVYHPVNHFIETHIKKTSRRRGRSRRPRSSSESSLIEDSSRVEDYLRDDHLLYKWSRPQQLLTPIECFPTQFPIDGAAVASFFSKTVRCNQSNDYLVMTA